MTQKDEVQSKTDDSSVLPPTEAKISFYEKHKKIYIREVSGLWNTWRWWLVLFTQVVFYALPWFQWNDRQAVLLHLVDRKFYFFGMVLWPQDVFYLAVLLIISAYALFLFTAIAGRLFCGYICPQTVYTEIFMWVENRIEGNRSARIKRDQAPLNTNAFMLKAAKHFLWGIISLWTGFTLVAYFTPLKELIDNLPFGLSGWETFWVLSYAFFLYMQAGFLREQVCKYMCPYARFQAVMFDPDTLVITYDAERGEPRGVRRKGTDSAHLGDCVDCNLCYVVCPTGIDIRDGMQYECIGCGACIDVCDPVMVKTGKPKGLIRYTTENALEKHWGKSDVMRHILRPRIILYSVVLFGITVAMLWSLATQIPLKVNVIRDRSLLAREAPDGRIENVYNLRIMNTTELPQKYRLAVEGFPGIEIMGNVPVEVASAKNHDVTVVVSAPPEVLSKGANPIRFTVTAESQTAIQVKEKASFLMP